MPDNRRGVACPDARRVRLVDEVQYAVRVRDDRRNAALAASQIGLEVSVEPERTVLHGRVPDQAALLGTLAKVRLLGLELVEVRRLPQGGRSVRSWS
jgi:hypothetical protein